MSAAPVTPKHPYPSVWFSVLTFYTGLLGIRVALGLLLPDRVASNSYEWVDPLLALVIICTAATATYLFLRLEEGDFRALFWLTMALFGAHETCLYLARAYSLRAFAELTVPLAFACSIYGLLTFSAAACETVRPAHKLPRWVMFLAVGIIFALSLPECLHPSLQAFSTAGLNGAGKWERLLNTAGMAALGGAGLLFGLYFLRSVSAGGDVNPSGAAMVRLREGSAPLATALQSGPAPSGQPAGEKSAR